MKKNKPLVLILGIVLAAAVVVGLIFGVKALTKSDSETPASTDGAALASDPVGETGNAGESGSETDPTAEPAELDPELVPVTVKSVYAVDGLTADDPRLDQVVATCAGYELTNRQVGYYYFLEYFGFMSQYGDYATWFGLDETKPMSEQASIVEGLTWEQSFLVSGISANVGFSAFPSFYEISPLAAKAAADGYTVSEEDLEEVEQELTMFEQYAAYFGYASLEEFLQAYCGPAASVSEFTELLRTMYLGISYYNEKYESYYDEDALQTYYEENPDEFEGIPMQPNINIRHILISYDADEDGEATEEEKTAAKTKAEGLLEGFLADPSEEAFAALAKEYTDDPGSQSNGGLYEDVYPGQMVDAFNDWCFDATRQVGDTGIVETEYGYHIMYFAGQTDEYYWKTIALEGYAAPQVNEWFQSLIDESPVTVHYEDVILAPFPIPETE